MNLSYLEIDESFYNRVTMLGGDNGDTVVEHPVGFFMPSSFGSDFTCKFKGDYRLNEMTSFDMLQMLIYGTLMLAEQNPNTQYYCTLQIPSGNETYGKPSDIFDESTGTGLTFYGIINFFIQQYSKEYSNLHIIIETY